MNKKSQKLQTRDFISVGIFSLIYSAVAFIIGGIAQMTPITFPFMPMIVALFTGTVFMLYIAKIPKRGAMLGSGEINHFGPGENRQFWSNENHQSGVASPQVVLFTRPAAGQPVSQ